MSQTTPVATPVVPIQSAEAMRQEILALIEDRRIALRGFAENATTAALKDLAEKIRQLPVAG